MNVKHREAWALGPRGEHEHYYELTKLNDRLTFKSDFPITAK